MIGQFQFLKSINMKNIRDWGATVLAVIVAVAMDLMLIDWANFNFKKEWPKIMLSIIIAAGGYFSKIKTKKDDSATNS